MQRQYTFLLFLISMAIGVQAQPHYHQYGCKYTKNRLHKMSLTAGQRNLLNQEDTRSDSIDILHYDINIDVRDYGGKNVDAFCEVTFSPKVDGIDQIVLDLLAFQVDSVKSDGSLLPFTHDGNYVTADLAQVYNAGETTSITIYYNGQPLPDPSGFGGLVFEDGIIYNLGIGLSGQFEKYNFGRGWFPCFDNFVERATYDISIIAGGGRKGFAVGTFIEEEDLGNGVSRRKYSMTQPIPTYLVGVAAGNYRLVEQMHEGEYGEVPIHLVGKPGDTTSMKNAFQYLGDAIDACESWYGPYIWEHVGFVMTTVGAMEHNTLIAYPDFLGVGSPSFAQNRLMAHELMHHWWGNMTTLSSPSNMWIKEGNAEYGAHLFTEYTFGKAAFKEQVMDNWEDVLGSAHVDDDGFHPLSGIPYEHTYGTHTYNKGASIMHNLRAYLGDDLFSSGMTDVLNHFLYESINAEQFRDYLSISTGYDLTDFFDDQIFNPGFTNFELESVEVSQAGNDYEVDVEVHQKVRAAPDLYSNVPMEITFYDENWNAETYEFVATDEFSSASFTLSFNPVLTILNDNQKQNLARLQNRYKVKSTGNLGITYTDLYQINVNELTDSALISIVHHWVAPDQMMNNPNNYRLSSTHYWSFAGDVKGDFEAKVRFSYEGNGPNRLDYDLVSETEDSLILLWRPNPQTDWVEYPHYEKILVGPNNGFGFIDAEPLLLGDYCFANGESITLDNQNISEAISIQCFPNPVSDYLTVNLEEKGFRELRLKMNDPLGRSWKQLNIESQQTVTVPVSNLPVGNYWLTLEDQEGNLIHSEQILVNR
jgi:hypothetical protein